MLGNFSYHNPTKLYFGENSIQNLKDELPRYGKNVLFVYGGGSIKKNGIYDIALNTEWIYPISGLVFFPEKRN